MASFLQQLKSFDAYPKTLEDFRVRTYSGAAVSIISGLFIFWLFISEFLLYLQNEINTELFVDTTRGEKLRINMDLIFHNLPCDYISVDAMDVSGEHQLDIDHSIFKKRLAPDLRPLPSTPEKTQQLGDHTPEIKKSEELPPNYCGSCYGADPSPNACCNTCEQVQEAYRKKGWAFGGADQIEQCVREGWTKKMAEQMGEACQIYGYLLVNKVAGNFHFAPGKSFQQHHMHVHDLQPFKGLKFNLSHTINRLSFGKDFPGIINPLDGVKKGFDSQEPQTGMYQYFIKIVPTIFQNLNGEVTNTNQFSVSEHYKPLKVDSQHGLPGVFFVYELSPIMVKYTETSKSFAHFLTGVCAIIGGVFTVAGLIDSFIYQSMRTLKKKVELGKAS